jgi:hypothetical protein
MSVRHLVHAPATRSRLDSAIAISPPYLRPIIEAVRDNRVGMLFVGQSADPFRIPRDAMRSAIVIIGGDFDRAVGPQGFHMPSVRRAIRECNAFAVVSSAAQPLVYASIAFAAAHGRRNAMLIETRLEQELSWVGLIQKLAPGRHIWLATVEGGHA